MRDFNDVSHRIKLQAQCNNFRTLISKIAAGRENFLADMAKALRKVTDDWKTWKHQTYGKLPTKVYVSAIEQVRELLLWNRRMYKCHSSKHRSSATSYRKYTMDTLHNFLMTCNELEKLRNIFEAQILNQLKVCMRDDASGKYVVRLELILMHWKLLLSPGTISSNHYSMGSDVLLRQAELQDGCPDFYPVLRLIPDLCFKAEQCMELVQHCLYRNSIRGYKRERDFLLNVWLPKIKELERNTHIHKDVLTNTVIDLQLSSELVKVLEQEIKKNEKELESLAKDRDSLKLVLDGMQADNEKYNKMMESLKCQIVSIKEKLEKVDACRCELSSKISQSAAYLKRPALKDEEDVILRKKCLAQYIKENDELNDELNLLAKEMDSVEMKNEVLLNKIASQDWYVRKITRNLKVVRDKIEVTEKQLKEMKIEYRTLEIKKRINVTKLHRLSGMTDDEVCC